MKKTYIVIGCILALTGLVPTAFAFFDQNIDNIIVAANSNTVEGVSATAGNGSVILIWNSKKNEADEEAVGYRIEYGASSVAKGTASEYQSKKEIDDNIPSTKIEDLDNGKEYFFTVIAVFSDGTETPPSEEVSATPMAELSEDVSQAPIVISAEALSRSQVSIVFSEEIVLPEISPDLAFAITLENDSSKSLEILSAEYAVDPNSGTAIPTEVILETEDQKEDTSYRITASAQIVDTSDNPIQSGSTDNAVFDASIGDPVVLTPLGALPSTSPTVTLTGDEDVFPSPTPTASPSVTPMPSMAPEPTETIDDLFPLDQTTVDTEPPEDISNLMSTIKARLTDFLVTLRWTASANTQGDLSDQLLYRSLTDGAVWNKGLSLGKTATETSMAEQPETKVTYKITTKDVAGNESVGVIRSISLPALPATGPGILIFAGISIAGAGMRFLRKKQD